MSSIQHSTQSAPPTAHFPKWAALLNMPPDQDAAITEFLRMARADAKDPNEPHPTIRAKNYSSPAAHPYRVRFDLRDPDPVAGREGDQDHVLFKTVGNTHNRTHKGQRRPPDYDRDRAELISFIPETLLNPDTVRRVRNEPSKVVYTVRTAPYEYFMVLLEESSGNPRLSFITAYPMTQDEFKGKRREWDRLFPGNPKPPKKKRKN